MTILEIILVGVIALMFAVSLFTHAQYITVQRLSRTIVSRALRSLQTRGVSRKRAIELVCPELRDQLLKELENRRSGRGQSRS